MTISYNWLSEYLPFEVSPEKLSTILTSVGLEVESMEIHEQITGGLKGLIVGKVTECIKHPEADKLSVTKVDIGNELLQIVCGAPNVAEGQKVIVAPVGTTIYPVNGEPVTMKKAKIRGIESFGMICAEDEIGLGKDHNGIVILDDTAETGTPVKNYFNIKTDFIFEIGLTPNRMHAMSHIGVAKDVCAWFNHHENSGVSIVDPLKEVKHLKHSERSIDVTIKDHEICPRYSGVSISGITIGPSPQWLITRLDSIGLKSINNIVDVTNFILHETGQPLHAFDLDSIAGKKIIVQQLPEGTPFITLDNKERKLSAEDVMICDGNGAPMCIGGVFGGLNSGIKDSTKGIFLESANFNSALIRKTLVRHGLRTDAAMRFEKGVDISATVSVLLRAADLIVKVAGGEISSEVVDNYPDPKPKKEVTLKWDYLQKISGKNYQHAAVIGILKSLGFETKEENDGLQILVPFTNPDISLPVDIIEEIMRIDGLDNIEIPSAILIEPQTESLGFEHNLKDKISGFLSSNGITEILTNSITNSKYYTDEVLARSVKILNSLSIELDILKPGMLETALECIAYNLNRKNNELYFFEFGKTYAHISDKYEEKENLMIYVSVGEVTAHWKKTASKPDTFYLKGLVEKLALLAGVPQLNFSNNENQSHTLDIQFKKTNIGTIGKIPEQQLSRFSIKQPVFYVQIKWTEFLALAKKNVIVFEEIAKYPTVYRELSLVLDKSVTFEKVQKSTKAANINKLKDTNLLNIFESEKLGNNKRSLAMSYTFLDKEKTMTDKEIDSMMNRLIDQYETDLGAAIRR